MDGNEVLKVFDQAPVDLVILDLNMPGMSGMDTLMQLTKRLDAFNVPVLIVSAEDSEESIHDGLSSGASEYIIKPFKSAELLAKVRIALKKRDAREVSDMGMALGSRFAGRYLIQDRIGSGGFSTVFRAVDTHSEEEETVALKIFDLPPSKRNDHNFVSSFLREAYEHSKLRHPNIVELKDFGQIDGYYFLVMEFINGQTLEDFIKENGLLDEYHAAYICYEMVNAIEFMSQNSIVHRDIKPGNVILTVDGEVKLLDFGLAKKESENTLSIGDEFKGTPQFVSPEYIRDDPLDFRSDIYALGGTLYYLSCGKPPIEAKSAIETLRAHLYNDFIRMEMRQPDFDHDFCLLINSMLAKEANERPSLKDMRTICYKSLSRWREDSHS